MIFCLLVWTKLFMRATFSLDNEHVGEMASSIASFLWRIGFRLEEDDELNFRGRNFQLVESHFARILYSYVYLILRTMLESAKSELPSSSTGRS